MKLSTYKKSFKKWWYDGGSLVTIPIILLAIIYFMFVGIKHDHTGGGKCQIKMFKRK